MVVGRVIMIATGVTIVVTLLVILAIISDIALLMATGRTRTLFPLPP